MMILTKIGTSAQDIEKLSEKLVWMGFSIKQIQLEDRIGIALLQGVDHHVDINQFKAYACVDKIVQSKQPYKLASRHLKPKRTIMRAGQVLIGEETLAVMAGPCSIESEAQIDESAALVAKSGANILRGGAFKPRTSPYSFQGLGEEGLRFMRQAGLKYGLATVSEAMDGEHLELVAEYCDIVQIGARNMQNFSLLKQLGRLKNPILLKRGLAATYQEFLMASEYILNAGNPNVILCERGIRTYETYSRNTLDIAAVPILQELSHLPVIVDPSHGTGLRKMVPPMARAAVAAGADGIMVEVHPRPDEALTDADQTIGPEQFHQLMESLRPIANVVGRKI